MPKEIERRYAVFVLDRGTFDSRNAKLIEQGYYPTNDPNKILRVRRTDGQDIQIITKSGSGQVRDEQPIGFRRGWSAETKAAFLLDVGSFLLAHAPWRIAKKRYERDGWEIDVFEPPFHSLILAEHETSTPTTGDRLPPWITKAVEVTDTINNLLLAKLAEELREGAGFNPLMTVFIHVFRGGPIPPDILALITA